MSNQEFARVIIQQCISSRLQTNANSPDETPRYVSIERGIVVYVCFFKTASEETVEKMVNAITTVQLSKSLENESKLVSIVNLPGSILVVPQATLGGKMKGKRMQYHSNINKETGQKLYQELIEKLKSSLPDERSQVCAGTYGNLQVLDVQTNGPYTHVINFT